MPDPRPARTRRRFLDAGHRLISEKGVGGLRIAEVVQEAGAGMGSFYNHFATLDELVRAVAEDTLRTLAAEIVLEDPSPDQDAAVVAIAALRHVVRSGYRGEQFARLLVRLHHGDEVFVDTITPFATTAVQRAVDSGAFEVDDVALAVTAIVGGGMSVIRRVLEGELGPDADAAYARLVLRGLRVEEREIERIIAATDAAVGAA